MTNEFIIEPPEDDEFSRAVDAIIAKRGALKPKPPPPPPEPRGPESYEIAEPGDTLATAFAKGVEAGCANMAGCCGCSGTGPIVNPYDGSVIE